MIHSTQLHSTASATDKAQEYLMGWRRERAEFENYRRRVNEERETSKQKQRMAVIEPLLGVSDNLKSVVQHVPEDIADNPWTQGVLHVTRQFEQALEDQGITAIADTGVEYEPSLHEVIETVADDSQESGQIIEVLQVGYRMGESVIRPAKVKIVE